MSEPIRPYKLAFYTSLIAVGGFLGAVVAYFLLVKFLSLRVAYGELVIAFIGYIFTYYLTKFVFQKYETPWGVSLVTGNIYETFSGGSYLRFYLGFVWRLSVIAMVSNPLVASIAQEGAAGLPAGIIMLVLQAFVAFMWLFKYPFGATRLAFNIAHRHVPAAHDQEDLPVVIDSGARETQKLTDVVGGIFAGSMGGILMLTYFIVGCVQFVAIYVFFRDVWDWWMIPSFLGAAILAYMPLIGNVAGAYTAYNVWDWSLLWTLLFFFWPFLLMLGVLAVGALGILFEKRER